MSKEKKILFAVFFVGLQVVFHTLYGQTKDTLKARYDTLEPRILSLAEFREGFKPSTRQWQNTLDDFQWYHWTIYQDLFNFSTGNLGGPAFSPVLNTDTTTGLQLGINSLSKWNFSFPKMNLLETNVPFSRVAYYFGTKKENLILADHAQRFGKYVSGGFQLKRISSEGFYTNGKNTSTDLDVYFRVHSRNFRYGLLAAFLVGNNKNQENGGVVYQEGEAANLQEVNLLEAFSVSKRIGALLSHSYSIGKAIDSIPLDSIRKRGVYNLKIGHEFEFNQQKYSYSDPNQNHSYYPQAIGDSIIQDSFKLQSFENKIFLTNQNEQFFLRKWTAGVKSSLWFFTQETEARHSINTSLWGDIRLGFGKRMYLDAYAQMELSGYNKGDFSIRPSICFLLGKDSLEKPNIRFGLLFANQAPAWQFAKWSTTHFYWDNAWNKSQIFRIDGFFSLPKNKLSVWIAYKTVYNFTYLDSLSLPKQLPALIHVLEAKLQKTFRWKKWGYYLNGQGQIISNTKVLPLPSYWGRTGLFFESWVFKKAMLMRVGTDFAYCSSFQSYAYQPELFQWYVNPGVKVGNAYSLDIYISARVKRSSFFFKYERLNAIWDSKPVYTVNAYPFPGGAMKFGINWIFMDYLPKADKSKDTK